MEDRARFRPLRSRSTNFSLYSLQVPHKFNCRRNRVGIQNGKDPKSMQNPYPERNSRRRNCGDAMSYLPTATEARLTLDWILFHGRGLKIYFWRTTQDESTKPYRSRTDCDAQLHPLSVCRAKGRLLKKRPLELLVKYLMTLIKDNSAVRLSGLSSTINKLDISESVANLAMPPLMTLQPKGHPSELSPLNSPLSGTNHWKLLRHQDFMRNWTLIRSHDKPQSAVFKPCYCII